jgi:tetratricopeptide (TPR) repeat protein
MSHKILLWTGMLGITVTIPLAQKITVAQTSLAQPLIGRIENVSTTGSRSNSIAESHHQDWQVTTIAQNTTPPAVQYLVSALQKYREQDYRGALADYDRAISIDPNYALAYNIRGLVKASKLQDYRGGLADMNRAISIDPKLAEAYRNRGELKSEVLHDVRGGLADYDMAIQLDPKFALAYGSRGLLKHDLLRDRTGGIADTQQAARLFQQQGDLKNYQVVVGFLKKWQQITSLLKFMKLFR